MPSIHKRSFFTFFSGSPVPSASSSTLQYSRSPMILLYSRKCRIRFISFLLSPKRSHPPHISTREATVSGARPVRIPQNTASRNPPKPIRTPAAVKKPPFRPYPFCFPIQWLRHWPLPLLPVSGGASHSLIDLICGSSQSLAHRLVQTAESPEFTASCTVLRISSPNRSQS